ncbi:hypothetical protein ACHHYP_12001 [Achlya hypogyna]|uniref:Uncharacterized protein n=1 Tax=Achlya hypogyna TaxID=1202772 RepID=A0A1V9YHX6_ACHHY|nr:hypothetical protein ACHHYP_12001 [Achlya hypogyna]
MFAELQVAHRTLLELYEESQRDAARQLEERQAWRRELDLLAQDKAAMAALLGESKAQLRFAGCLEHENKALAHDVAAKQKQIQELTGHCVLSERMLKRLELVVVHERRERARELEKHRLHTAELAMQLAEVQTRGATGVNECVQAREDCLRLRDAERRAAHLQRQLAAQEERWQQVKLGDFEAALRRMSDSTNP